MVRFNKQGKYNVPFGHKPNRFSKAYITKIINQISYVYEAIHIHNSEFSCVDFRISIKEAGASDFIYCDPPYAGRNVDYFNSWSEKDENDLYALLNETESNFILSTWHSNEFRTNPSIKRYEKNNTIITREHFYHIGANEENRRPIVEALVLNYKPKFEDEARVYEKAQITLF